MARTSGREETRYEDAARSCDRGHGTSRLDSDPVDSRHQALHENAVDVSSRSIGGPRRAVQFVTLYADPGVGMHEFAIVSSLLESVEQHARQHGAKRVVAINLIVGERSGIVDDSLTFYFDILVPGTAVDGARLNVRHVPLRFHCAPCDADYCPGHAGFECPNCGRVGRIVDDGSQLTVESMEIET